MGMIGFFSRCFGQVLSGSSCEKEFSICNFVFMYSMSFFLNVDDDDVTGATK